MSRPKVKPRSAKATLVRVQLDPALRSSLVHLPICLYAPLVDRQVSPQSLVVEIDPHTGTGDAASARQPYYAGWTGMSAAPLDVASSFSSSSASSSSASVSDVISISPSLAASFRPPLAEGAIASVRLLRSPPLPTAEKIEVTPLSPDDWEILSIHAEEVEINMLGQVRAAKTGQVIGVHVGRAGKTVVRFRVDATTPPTSDAAASTSAGSDDVEPKKDTATDIAVRLSTDSEVIIAPRLRPKRAEDHAAEERHDLNAGRSAPGNGASGSAREQAERREAISKLLWRILPDHFVKLPASEGWLQNAVLVPSQSSPAFIDSMPGFAELDELFPKGRIAITKVTCPSSDLTKSGGETRPEANAGAANNGEPQDSAEAQGGAARAELPTRPTASAFYAAGEGYLRVGGGTQAAAPAWPESHVAVGPALRRQLGLQDYDLVRFTPAPPGSAVRSATADASANGIGNGGSDDGGDLSAGQAAKTLAGVESILSTCIDIVSGTLRSRRLHAAAAIAAAAAASGGLGSVKPFAGSSGLLLTGGPGSGKTVVAEEISSRLSSDPGLLMSTSRIDCSPFAEERVPVLRAKFSEWLNEAAWKAPSLLVLDNIDRIIPAELEHVDSQRSRQLAEAFVARIRDCVKDFEVFVVATAQNNTSIHSLLNSSHLWIDNVQLKPPSKEGRREILAHLVRGKTAKPPPGATASAATATEAGPESEGDLNFVTLATQTEGYLPADLKDLVERAVHQSAIRAAAAESRHAPGTTTDGPLPNGDAPPRLAEAAAMAAAAGPGGAPSPAFQLTMADFAKAQEGFTPLSLRDVKLEKSSVAWSDIGGLVETRRVLRETLEWPTKYAAIFASCPLRLRSGLLLYGYPGCGKTLLASAVAKECGLNFISVKGPEILNKYIGASEKSVRDLFDRAQAAKPCVLFFDEFDSIAPKRGHDSTGVTDRVVNQMLTQMDGAEGLDGVYVLAATSRPDLIDSALLRPGRLDKSLLCDMPTLEDRVDIMEAISRKVHLDPAVDLQRWAQRTEGYSGADLQALLYNAHLETIHDSINAAAADQGGADGEAAGADKRDGGAGKPARFISFGGSGGGPGSSSGAAQAAGAGVSKKTMSGAEQQALSRKLELVLQNQRRARQAASSSGQRGSDLGASTSKAANGARAKVLVTDSHLETSLKATRPSVPVEEQRRLKAIYKAFAGERDANFPDGQASDQIGARSSLM
ncbi:uncharacterized protein PFL1_06062 [Pseudozyma flocculosa PF-1]|uniref:Peroxisomal ATPase PEX1 n=2 Tax=Pseudozyma flocculosa TaxID=84751 RepID=A0A5C3F3T0_9BASI|nr:uncharacterized protein PFL1_06062 [Pseudozyma flocculosa PF-1]EPQ26414.1 hypothetical protein PFL1_06062 [Pseudozyma flocculosa PF-1]SPO38992.1 related to PEX1 - peroxisomal assembly protein -peroxin [Pseudozyma flocculosa]